MGRLTANINLARPDVLSSALSVGVGISVEADSGHLTRSKIAATSAGASALTVYKASDKLDTAYVYVKNMSAIKEEYIYVYADTAADDPVILKLGGNEFAFMPIKNDITLKAYATRKDQIVEYGVFGLDSSSITLS
jgi:dihydropteroate synthase